MASHFNIRHNFASTLYLEGREVSEPIPAGRIADSTLGALIEVISDTDVPLSPLRREYVLSALNELAERRDADRQREAVTESGEQ